MKTIGLIGGMSWESSLEYYRLINETVAMKLGGLHSAQCLMYSVDFQEIETLQHQNRWDKLTDIMVAAAARLKNGGADFVVICTNTMHKVANDIETRAGIKVLHIAEVTGYTIAQKGMKKVGLLGTKFTMEQDFYKQVLKEKFDITAVIPEEAEREFIHHVIYHELCQGMIRSDSRARFTTIIDKLAANGAAGVVLGCTEIPLLVRQADVEIPVFDTTRLHAVAAVEYALK